MNITPIHVKIIFFKNGNTGIFRNHFCCYTGMRPFFERSQIPEIQQSWFLKFVEFAQVNGIDPEACEFYMPESRSKVIKTEDGYNWETIP